MLLSRNAFAFLLVISAAQVQAQSQNPIENLIPKWLPQCFTGLESFNPLSIIECIRENAGKTCLERMTFEGTITDIVDCVNTTVTAEVTAMMEGADDTDKNPVESFLSNNLGVNMGGTELMNVGQFFVGSALACIDPYATCVQETIEAAVQDNLDPCLRQTVTDLVECGRTNSETCQETCNKSPDEAEGLGLSLPALPVSTCASIQTNIMNPMCGVVSCCEPCLEKVEALVECVVNQQLDQVPTLGGQCNDLACPVVQKRERRLGQEKTMNSATTDRILLEDNNNVEKCLEFAPGLTGDDSGELSSRSAIFMPCVSDSFLKAVEEGTATDTVTTATASSAGESGTDSETSEGADANGESDTDSGALEGADDAAANTNSGGRTGSVGAFTLITGAAISFYAL
jgi:hypothetical protein